MKRFHQIHFLMHLITLTRHTTAKEETKGASSSTSLVEPPLTIANSPFQSRQTQNNDLPTGRWMAG
jgi:hypothetical protein